MRSYGNIFREIRLSKQMTLKDVSDQTISLPFLSKYERGLCDISVSNFFSILNKLNVSVYEFDMCYNTLENSDQLSFIKKWNEAFNTNNLLLCNKIILEEEKFFKMDKNIRHKHNIIIVKQYINNLTDIKYNKDSTKQIINYLLKVEEWSYYELTLYGNSLFFIPIEKVFFLLKTAIKKSRKFQTINVHKNELCLILTNIISIMLDSEYSEKKNELITIFNLLDDELKDTQFYYEINKVNFLKGIFLLQCGDFSGKEKCLTCIDIMIQMGDFNLANNHNIYLNDILFKLYEKNQD